MEAFVIDPAQLIRDIAGCIAELRSINLTSQQAVSDDETSLHKFCVKLETVLRHEQREKYTLLGTRKDYWNFIAECIPKDDGIKYVNAIPQMKSSQGKGRAFIRYALVQKTLADTIQRCLVSKKHTRSWYRHDAILQNHSLCTALINKLYDLNDVDFDLPCAGHDLDISWPAFSRQAFGEGFVSRRRGSITSLTSTDFRNERPDPLIGLAAEVSSLRGLFSHESPLAKLDESGETFDNVSIADSAVDQPSVAELTLHVSHVHQQLLKWKADLESRLAKSQNIAKKAWDDRQFALQESELKIKQLHEKFTNLTRAASEESNVRTGALSEKLKMAEELLRGRDAEISKLREEVKNSTGSFHGSQKSVIELERKLASSERDLNDQQYAKQRVEEKLALKDQSERDLRLEVDRKQETIEDLQERSGVLKEKLSEMQGDLKAKEVALVSVQESFEKLNGMVFGSFEELESELKARLLDKDKGLENQSAENRRLELSMVEVQQQNRDVQRKLADAKLKIQELESSNHKTVELVRNMDVEAQRNGQKIKNFEEFTARLGEVFRSQGKIGEPSEKQEESTSTIINCLQELVKEMSVTQETLNIQTKDKQTLEQRVSDLREENQGLDSEITSLKEDISTSKNELQLLEEKNDQMENEKLEIVNKLAVLEMTEKSLRSDLSVITEEKLKSENELSIVKEQQSEGNEARTRVEATLIKVKQQLQETNDSKQKLVQELNVIADALRTLEDETTNRLALFKEQVSSLQDEKSTLEHEIEVARQQLEAANEARIRAEQGQMRTQEQLESVRCMMDQEIAALKFQLSSETMKYETEIKVLSAESQESAVLRDRVTEQEEVIADLEARVKERNDAWQNDRHKYITEIKHLRNEIQSYKGAVDANKQRIVSLENELLLATKQLEEENARQKELKRKMEATSAQKALTEEKCDQKIAETNKDMIELKQRLIELTKEKADLWKKADDMEHEIKVKATDRWVDDSEVANCATCKTEFSFLVRRHHCRSCGRIFCHSCVNNWVRTPHSRKLKRVCSQCVESDRKLKSELVRGRHGTDDEDSMSDISVDSSQRHGSLFSLGEDDDGRSALLFLGEGSSAAVPQASSPLESKKGKFTKQKQLKSGTTSNSAADSNDSQDDQYTSLTAVKVPGRNAPQRGLSSESSNIDEQFEFINPDEEAEVQPDQRVIISQKDMRAEIMIPTFDDKQGEFREVVVSAGKRYVLPVLVGTPGTTLCWKFSTAKKSITFGVAYKASESRSDEEIQTRLPLAEYASHLHVAKGQLKADCPGCFLLVFDNTFSRFMSERVFYVVQIKRRNSAGVESELE